MRTRHSPKLSVFLMLVTASSACFAQQPNILYIIADDMAADTVSFGALQQSLGNGTTLAGNINTPSLDALANSGTTFINAYNQGGWSGAVCRTSRTAIMTGRPMWTVPGSDQEDSAVANANTLPGLFNSAGYDTARFGKSSNDYDPATNTFTTRQESNNRNATSAAWFADRGIEYLDNKIQNNDSDPYLLYLGFSHPHDPRNAPQEYLDAHGAQNGSPDPSAPLNGYDPLPSSYQTAHSFDFGDTNVRDENSVAGIGQNRDERSVRNEVSKNHAVIEFLDSQIQRTIDKALEFEGLTPGVHGIDDLQNTVIVFTADHGIAVGRNGLVGKQSIYEHSTRVPYIVAGAVNGQQINNGVSDKNVYLHDSLPTLLDLAGVQSNASVTAESFADELSTDQATRDSFTGHEAVFGSYSTTTTNHVQRSVKIEDGDDVWKLIHYPQINRTQLFNLATDPDETDDLSGNPQFTPIIDTLAEELHEQQVAFSDPAAGQLGRLGINLARDKTATQSSGSSADLALNGAGAVESTLAGGIGGGNSLERTTAATTNQENNPWWMVDLGSTQEIGEIALHNSTSNDSTLRLDDIRVEILDSAMSTVFTSDLLSISGADDWITLDLDSNSQQGQFVRVTRESNSSVLALDEVQVFSPLTFITPPIGGLVDIQWGPAQNTSDISDLSLASQSNVVLALNGGGNDVTADGISFTATSLSSGVFEGALSGSTSGDSGYDSLLNTFTFGDGEQTTIEIEGLDEGRLYAVQVWFTDLRDGENIDGRTITLTSDGGDSVDIVGNPLGEDPADFLGQNAIGVFTATDENALVELLTNGFSNVHFNGLVVFELLAGDLTDASGIAGSPDGVIDANDWQMLRNNLFADLDANLSATESYLQGDLNQDGIVNIIDFRLFKDAFLAQPGATESGFDALVTIPEPASLMLTVIGLGCWNWRRSR